LSNVTRDLSQISKYLVECCSKHSECDVQLYIILDRVTPHWSDCDLNVVGPLSITATDLGKCVIKLRGKQTVCSECLRVC